MKLLKSTFLGTLLLSVPALGADIPSETIDVTGVASKPKKPDLGLEVIPYSLNTLDFNFPTGFPLRTTNADVRAFYERIGYKLDDVVSFGKRLEPDD